MILGEKWEDSKVFQNNQKSPKDEACVQITLLQEIQQMYIPL